jgi:hypothetical protein
MYHLYLKLYGGGDLAGVHFSGFGELPHHPLKIFFRLFLSYVAQVPDQAQSFIQTSLDIKSLQDRRGARSVT